MDAKLIKKNNIFYLYVDESWSIASTDAKDNRDKKLSLKNCQAIERGYDLDELALYAYKPETSINHSAMYKYLAIRFFKEGFQKALSILGDKKFSEEDVRKAFVDAFQKCYEVINSGKFDDITSAIEWLTQTNADNYIQSLKQTEWDVWLVMACGLPDGCTEPEVTCTCDIIPSLDADGCLILKKI